MLKLTQPLTRAAAGHGEQLTSLLSANVPQLSALLPRSWVSSSLLSTILPFPSSMKSASVSLSTHLRVASRAAMPGVSRNVGGALSRQLLSSRTVGSRPLTHSLVQRRSYAKMKMSSWDEMPPMAPPTAPFSPLAFLWRGTKSIVSFAALVLNATAVYFIHADLHRENPTWVSYLSFIPVLEWIPLLDIAGLDRAWVLAPAALIGGMAVAAPALTPVLAGLLFVAPLMALEVYRNYHILEHFEQNNWLTLGLLTFFRFDWLVFSSLAILGTDRYQLVPHNQASLSESVIQVSDRLDYIVENPSELDKINREHFNLPLHVISYVWQKVPALSGYAHQFKEWHNLKPEPEAEPQQIAATEAVPVVAEEKK